MTEPPDISDASHSQTVLGIFSAFAIGILAGVICYWVLERPMLAIGRRLIRRIEPAS